MQNLQMKRYRYSSNFKWSHSFKCQGSITLISLLAGIKTFTKTTQWEFAPVQIIFVNSSLLPLIIGK